MTTVYHSYRTAYTTVRQPPGFGDFLRGSLALAILSFEKGFALRLDLDHHPIGRFLREKVPPDRSPEDFVEFFNERSPLLRTFVESLGPDESVGVTTNTHPDISLLTEATRHVVRSQLAFDDSVETSAAALARTISNGPFAVLHIRVADGNSGIGAGEARALIRYVMRHVKPKWGAQVAVISNAKALKQHIADTCGLPFIDTAAVHLGECTGTNSDVRDALIDFALLARAGEIFSWSHYPLKSGFSYWCAVLHAIPFVQIPPLGVGERLKRRLVYMRWRAIQLAAALGMIRN